MAKSDIVLDVKVEGTGKAKKEAQGIKRSFLETATGLNQAFELVGKVIGPVFDIISGGIADAAALSKQLAAMDSTLSAITPKADKYKKSFVDFANAMELSTTSTADQVIEMQNLALQMTQAPDKVNGMTKAALALSAATGISAEGAIRNIAKSFGGMTGELGELVPAVRLLTKEQLMNGEAVKLISEQFQPALNAELATTAGQYERLVNIVGSRYTEALGSAFTDSEVFRVGLEELGSSLAMLAPDVGDLQSFLEKAVKSIGSLVGSILGWGATVSNFIGAILQTVGQLGSMIARALLKPLEVGIQIAKKLGDFIELPQAVQNAFILAEGMVEQLGDSAEQSGDQLGKFFNDIAGGMKTAELVTNRVTGAMERSGKAIKKVTSAAKDNAKAMQKVADAQMKVAAAARETFLQEQAAAQQAAVAQAEKLRADTASMIRDQHALDAGRTAKATADVASQGGGGMNKFAEMGLGFLGEFIDMVIEGFKNPEVFEKMIEGIGNLIENLGDPAVLTKIVNSVVRLAENLFQTLAKPGFISNIVKAVIRAVIRVVFALIPQLPAIGMQIIRAIIEGFWVAIKEFGKGLLNFFGNLIKSIFSRNKKKKEGGATTAEGQAIVGNKLNMSTALGVTAAIQETATSGAVGAQRDIIFDRMSRLYEDVKNRGSLGLAKVFLQQLTSAFNSLGDKKDFQERFGVSMTMLAMKGMDSLDIEKRTLTVPPFNRKIKLPNMHTGGIVGSMRPRGDVPIIAQQGEAVIPNSPRSFQGMSTNNGRVVGGGANIVINAIDSQSFEQFMRRKGMDVVNNLVRRGVTDARGRKFATG